MTPSRKTRSDRWDAALTDEQRWRAYAAFTRSPWAEFLAWAGRELQDAPLPGRNALYDWARDMRRREAAHRLEQAAQARAEVGALAETAALDGKLGAAYKSLAATAALNGDAPTAVRMTQMAMALAAQQTRQAELNLKAAAQQTKDAQLRLAREKFEAAEKRLTAVENLAGDTALTPQQREAKLKALFGLA